VPIGAYAVVQDSDIVVRAVVVAPDGSEMVKRESSGPAAAAATIGQALGEQLLYSGGRKILDAVYGSAADPALSS
jgi:hydroxymethylbilane synthase